MPEGRGVIQLGTSEGTVVPLEDLKVFLRVDHSEHDALLTSLLSAATERVGRHIGGTLTTSPVSGATVIAPDAVKTAVMMVSERLYNSAGASADPLTPAVRSMLAPFRQPVFA